MSSQFWNLLGKNNGRYGFPAMVVPYALSLQSALSYQVSGSGAMGKIFPLAVFSLIAAGRCP
jgi:hypothetical protein